MRTRGKAPPQHLAIEPLGYGQPRPTQRHVADIAVLTAVGQIPIVISRGVEKLVEVERHPLVIDTVGLEPVGALLGIFGGPAGTSHPHSYSLRVVDPVAPDCPVGHRAVGSSAFHSPTSGVTSPPCSRPICPGENDQLNNAP